MITFKQFLKEHMNTVGAITLTDKVPGNWMKRLEKVHADLNLDAKTNITMWPPSDMVIDRGAQVMIWLPHKMDVDELQFFGTMAGKALKKQLPEECGLRDEEAMVYRSNGTKWMNMSAFIDHVKGMKSPFATRADAVVFFVTGLKK